MQSKFVLLLNAVVISNDDNGIELITKEKNLVKRVCERAFKESNLINLCNADDKDEDGGNKAALCCFCADEENIVGCAVDNVLESKPECDSQETLATVAKGADIKSSSSFDNKKKKAKKNN